MAEVASSKMGGDRFAGLEVLIVSSNLWLHAAGASGLLPKVCVELTFNSNEREHGLNST